MLCFSKFTFTCLILLIIICFSSGENTCESFVCFLWKFSLGDLIAHKTSSLEYGCPKKSNILFTSVYVLLIKFSYPTTSTGISVTFSHRVMCTFHSWDFPLTSLFQAKLFTTKINNSYYSELCMDRYYITCTESYTYVHTCTCSIVFKAVDAKLALPTYRSKLAQKDGLRWSIFYSL